MSGGSSKRAASAAPTSAEPSALGPNLRFQSELLSLLYSCGDVETPRLDTVQVLESIVLSYIASLMQVASMSSKGAKVTPDDIKWVLRRDKRKLNRVEELLRMAEDIKKAKQAFDVED